MKIQDKTISNSKKKNLEKKQPKLSMVLFMYNEEKAIQLVVEELVKILKKAKISHQIILVEGGSTDNCFNAAKQLEKKHPQCVVLKNGKLIGEKIISGLKQVKGEYVGIMYSDGQVDPLVIPSFLNILAKGKTDIVKGTRKNRSGFKRYIISLFFNAISYLLFSIKSKDINGHPKIFSAKLIPVLNLQAKDGTIDLEMLVKSKLLNLKIKEIPVEERNRIGGYSYVNLITPLRILANILSYKWGKKKAIFKNL